MSALAVLAIVIWTSIVSMLWVIVQPNWDEPGHHYAKPRIEKLSLLGIIVFLPLVVLSELGILVYRGYDNRDLTKSALRFVVFGTGRAILAFFDGLARLKGGTIRFARRLTFQHPIECPECGMVLRESTQPDEPLHFDCTHCGWDTERDQF